MRELNTTRRAGKSQKFRLEFKPGASAHRPRSADLQSAVSRICNPQGMNSSTAAGQLARRRLQIGDTAGLETCATGWRCRVAPIPESGQTFGLTICQTQPIVAT
jgi:hypothetical protein